MVLAFLRQPIGGTDFQPTARWSLYILIFATMVGTYLVSWDYMKMGEVLGRYNTFYRPPERINLPYEPYLRDDIPRLFWDDDTYMRFVYLEEQHAAHAWRWRWTMVDNYPYGRIAYWTSPYNWWTDAWALGYRILHNCTYERSLEWAGAMVNPALHILLLFLLAVFLPRRLGYGLAAIVVLLSATLPGLTLYDYKAYQCDHQGMHSMSLMLAFFCMFIYGVGWIRDDDASRKAARAWFIVSGLMAGFGIWLGSSREIVVWLFVGLGMIAAVLIPSRRTTDGVTFYHEPRLWQYWGRSAALMTLFGYIVDFVPDHMDLTMLDVVHPLHAVSFFCAGELLYFVARLRHDPATLQPRHALFSFILFLSLILLPVLIAFGPQDWIYIRNPVMTQMAVHIEESQPAINGQIGFFGVIDQVRLWFGTLLLLPLVGGVVFFLRRSTAEIKAQLLFSGIPIIFILLLFLYHMRSWSYFLNPLLIAHYLAIALALNYVLKGSKARTPVFSVLLVLTIIQCCFYFSTNFTALTTMAEGKASAPELLEAAIQREMALHLKMQNPGKKLIFMAPSMLGTRLAYFSGGACMGSQYENVGGVVASNQFFSDIGSLENAKRIVQERHITHVIVNVCRPFLDTTVTPPENRPPGLAGVTLGERLCMETPIVPEWLEPLPSHPYLFNDYKILTRMYSVNKARLVMNFSSKEE